MAKTRRAKTPSPSAYNSTLRASHVRDSMTEPPQPPAIPLSEDGALSSPPQRRYQTRRPPTTPGVSSSRPKKSASHPPTKKARVSAPSEPQPPTTESQIPSGMTPEVVIRRPMVTQPPIEGNLDFRARPFHSELCFDRETFKHQPESPNWTRASRDTTARGATTAIVVLTPEATSSAPPTTPGTPPVVPATSAPHPSESSITISISEFKGLCHTLQTLTTTQSILAHQMAVVHAHQDQLIETPIPSTQTSTAEPSSPQDPPTTT
ncbi:hypothetical protein AAG906_027949 [Vitis piasezkii]